MLNRCLTALRLSLSSLLGIVRKRPLLSLRSSIRFAQHDICGGCRANANSGQESDKAIAVRHPFVKSRESSLCGPEPPPAEARKRAPQAPVRKSLQTLPWNSAGSAPGNNCCIRRSAECRLRPEDWHKPFGRAKICRTRPANYSRGSYEHRPDASRGVR